jgi:hypothetical protein
MTKKEIKAEIEKKEAELKILYQQLRMLIYGR